LNIEREKIRIMVRPEQVGVAAEEDAVIGTGEVRIIVIVSGREVGVQIQAGLAGFYLGKRARDKYQYDRSEDGDIFTHSL